MSSVGKSQWQRESVGICLTTSSKGNYPPTIHHHRFQVAIQRTIRRYFSSHSWLEQGWAGTKIANCQVNRAWSSMKKWEPGQSDYLCWERGLGKPGTLMLVIRKLSQFIMWSVGRLGRKGSWPAGRRNLNSCRDRNENVKKCWGMRSLMNIHSTRHACGFVDFFSFTFTSALKYLFFLTQAT